MKQMRDGRNTGREYPDRVWHPLKFANAPFRWLLGYRWWVWRDLGLINGIPCRKGLYYQTDRQRAVTALREASGQ